MKRYRYQIKGFRYKDSQYSEYTSWEDTLKQARQLAKQSKPPVNIVDIIRWKIDRHCPHSTIEAGSAKFIETIELDHDKQMKRFNLYWSPTGQLIGTVDATSMKTAIRKAPKPYKKYLGEIYAVAVNQEVSA